MSEAELYHYTNAQGLKGILENRCLWATHYKFLNDSAELTLAKDKLREKLFILAHQFHEAYSQQSEEAKKLINDWGGSLIATDKLLNIFFDSAFKGMFGYSPYIASFSCYKNKQDYVREHGLLSQWRGYGEGGGYAIVFDRIQLTKMLNIEFNVHSYLQPLSLKNVVYSPEDYRYQSELSNFENPIFDLYKWHFENHFQSKTNSESDSKLIDIGVDALFKYCACFKHQGFVEEQEARIIAAPDQKAHGDKCVKEIKFREKNGLTIPYIEIFKSLNTELPIKKIIVGPHKDKELRAAALRIKLEKTIDVTVSEIPFV